jgi:hypothetical protein
MDTRDNFSTYAPPADDAVNPNPLSVDPSLEEAAQDAGEAVADEVKSWNWKLIGAIAGGVALAAGVGAALYLKAQHDREQPIKRLGLDRLGLKRKHLDQANAGARRLAKKAQQRARALPVRQVTKTVVNKVSALLPQ